MKAFVAAVLFTAAASFWWYTFLNTQQQDAVATFQTQGVRL